MPKSPIQPLFDEPNLVTPLAKLIKKCAFEMMAADRVHIVPLGSPGKTIYSGTVTDGPSAEGVRICEETARGAGFPQLGLPAYLLLAIAWNDALDWADANGGGPG